ncbi:MAG: heme exporter protein CcmD [Pseudomonadota bacterium]
MLGEHGGFILASYLASAGLIIGLIVWTFVSYQSQKRRLQQLEATHDRRSESPIAAGDR